MPGLFGTFMHTAINGHAAIVLGGIATSGGLLAGLMGRGWLRKTLDQEPVVFFSGVAAAVGITCARAPPPALRAPPRRARALSRPETARALHFPSLARARPLHSLPIVVLPVMAVLLVASVVLVQLLVRGWARLHRHAGFVGLLG